MTKLSPHRLVNTDPPSSSLSSKDCGTGIPCNWKVYAAAKSDQNSYGSNAEQNSRGIFGSRYIRAVFGSYKKDGDFDKIHSSFEEGYGSWINKLSGQQSEAVSSKTGTAWGKETTIDHAVIFYDPKDKNMIADNAVVTSVLKKRNPNIIIESIPVKKQSDFETGFSKQLSFVQENPGKEEVLVLNTSHGTLKKYLKKIDGDYQGSIGFSPLTLSENAVESHMQNIACEVENGYFVNDACGSGAFADNDIPEKK